MRLSLAGTIEHVDILKSAMFIVPLTSNAEKQLVKKTADVITRIFGCHGNDLLPEADEFVSMDSTSVMAEYLRVVGKAKPSANVVLCMMILRAVENPERPEGDLMRVINKARNLASMFNNIASSYEATLVVH